MADQQSIKHSSRDALLGSLKDTVSLGTKEFAKSVGVLFHADKSHESIDKNQISHELDKREKALQKDRI